MTRKKVILTTAFFIVAAILYVIVYGDRFRRASIQISHTHERVIRRPAAANARVTPHPSGVKAVGSPVWHLVTQSNSNPVTVFRYGANINGMRPAETNTRALPLTNNLHYRLLVEAGKTKGSHDFTLTDEDYPENAGE